MGNPGTPQLEMREYRPFEKDNTIPVLVCTHCGKGNPANVFCDCPFGMFASQSFDAASRRPDRIPVPADFPVRQAHRFSTLSAFCVHCRMPRTAALDLNSVYCMAEDLAAELKDAVARNDWDRAAAIRTEALKRSGKPIREQMERKAAELFNSIGVTARPPV